MIHNHLKSKWQIITTIVGVIKDNSTNLIFQFAATDALGDNKSEWGNGSVLKMLRERAVKEDNDPNVNDFQVQLSPQKQPDCVGADLNGVSETANEIYEDDEQDEEDEKLRKVNEDYYKKKLKSFLNSIDGDNQQNSDDQMDTKEFLSHLSEPIRPK